MYNKNKSDFITIGGCAVECVETLVLFNGIVYESYKLIHYLANLPH